MLKEVIMKQWVCDEQEPAVAVRRWNESAPRYGAMELPKKETSLALRILDREGLLDHCGRGLDVGCGGGRFSFALEQAGWQMSGTDFSPEMIAQCQRRKAELHSNVSFSQDDWHTLCLGEKGWEKQFDLVLAHLTPAVADSATFQKLSDASRNAVLLLKPTRWRHRTLEELTHWLGLSVSEPHDDDSYAYAFSLAWLMGYAPKTDYQLVDWGDLLSTEDAIRIYTQWLEALTPLSDELRSGVCQFFKERSIDGQIQEHTDVCIAALFWRVSGTCFCP